MADTPKIRIFVVDDNYSERDKVTSLGAMIPGADFIGCAQFDDVYEACRAGGPPDAMIVDCCGFTDMSNLGENWGARNVIKMLKGADPALLPKTILIQSEDQALVAKTVDDIQRTIDHTIEMDIGHISGIGVFAMHKIEARLVHDVLSGIAVSLDKFRYTGTSTFRQYLNDNCGLSLPVTKEEESDCVLNQVTVTPDEIERLLEVGTITLPKALGLLRSEFISACENHLGTRVKYKNDLDWEKSCFFQHRSGDAVNGPVAFTVDEVSEEVAAGEKPIFIMQDYDPDQIPLLLGKIGGVVMLSDKMPAHMATLFAAHGISGLYGPQVSCTVQTDESGKTTLFYKGVTVSSGDRVTLETHYNTFYPGDSELYKPDYYGFGWIGGLQYKLAGSFKKSGAYFPEFKITIDNLKDMQSGENCGLIRTESLMAATEEGLQSFRAAILTPSEETLSAFEEQQCLMMKDLLLRRPDNVAVRVRLIDAKPEEFFKEDDLQSVATLYGAQTMRGVQLAAQIPGFYEAQIRAICQSFEVEAGYRDDDISIEIMVPTVRTEAEALAVKAAVDRIAAECGLKPEQVRFGVMMETLEAGRNIEKIVPHCDFISIGSNDYTAESLDCQRGDWEKRHRLTVMNGNMDPFTSLTHPKVLGELTDIVHRARTVKPDLQIDLCGDQGADPVSLKALMPLRLNAISVRPTFMNLSVLPLALGYQVYDGLALKTQHSEVIENKQPIPGGPV